MNYSSTNPLEIIKNNNILEKSHEYLEQNKNMNVFLKLINVFEDYDDIFLNNFFDKNNVKCLLIMIKLYKKIDISFRRHNITVNKSIITLILSELIKNGETRHLIFDKNGLENIDRIINKLIETLKTNEKLKLT